MKNNTIGIIDYGEAGNIASIYKSITSFEKNAKIIKDPNETEDCTKLILPGVGAFNESMKIIRKNNWDIAIKQFAHKKPILGICLGMQILSKVGFEFGETNGLNLIDAEVKLISCKAPIPHIGFKKIKIYKQSKLFDGIDENDEFYFMHSYEMVNYTDFSALCEHGFHTFVCAIEKDNIFGVQFHPEKSRQPGIKILKNFVGI